MKPNPVITMALGGLGFCLFLLAILEDMTVARGLWGRDVGLYMFVGGMELLYILLILFVLRPVIA
jgi:hypothetical protein